MNLDQRLPMGMMFSIVGAIVMAFGLATRTRPALYTRSFGIDVNIWWGAVLLVCGFIVVSIGRRGQGRIEQSNGQGQIVAKKTKPR